jgi:GT2 family glycosyltransferase
VPGKPAIAVLMTCHNRRELTLACLESLRSQPLFCEQNLYLVDDGSSDGTGDAVRSHYPSARVITGDGSLFWNGGMRLAWDTACASDREFDFYLWLNDDVRLEPWALDMLVADADAQVRRGDAVIVAAATREPGTDEITYGAHSRTDRRRPLRLKLLAPAGKPVAADSVSGNVVLISAAAQARLGNLRKDFEHIYGDIDYGFRAVAADIPVYLASRFGGTCPGNPQSGTSSDSTLSRRARMKLRWAEDRRVHGRDWRRFVRLHGGGMLAVLLYRLSPYLRIMANRPNRHASEIANREAAS